jgi:hypothetical protein
VASENFWCLGAFSVIWINGGLRCHFGPNLESLRNPSLKQEKSTSPTIGVRRKRLEIPGRKSATFGSPTIRLEHIRPAPRHLADFSSNS